MDAPRRNNTSTTSSALWVFGYGSLCWRPGFKFDRAVAGHVKGFARRFYQGNTTHRGTQDKPGRVATLVEEDEGLVWGCAFAVSGEAALPYLQNRECKLGGYVAQFAQFHPRGGGRPTTVMLYVATPKNTLWLGEAPLDRIVDQILDASGDSGHNVEYLLRLAEFMRRHAPDAEDEHLFGLEEAVRRRLDGPVLAGLLGDEPQPIELEQLIETAGQDVPRELEPERPDSYQFTTRLPEKMLRCLNI